MKTIALKSTDRIPELLQAAFTDIYLDPNTRQAAQQKTSAPAQELQRRLEESFLTLCRNLLCVDVSNAPPITYKEENSVHTLTMVTSPPFATPSRDHRPTVTTRLTVTSGGAHSEFTSIKLIFELDSANEQEERHLKTLVNTNFKAWLGAQAIQQAHTPVLPSALKWSGATAFLAVLVLSILAVIAWRLKIPFEVLGLEGFTLGGAAAGVVGGSGLVAGATRGLVLSRQNRGNKRRMGEQWSANSAFSVLDTPNDDGPGASNAVAPALATTDEHSPLLSHPSLTSHAAPGAVSAATLTGGAAAGGSMDPGDDALDTFLGSFPAAPPLTGGAAEGGVDPDDVLHINPKRQSTRLDVNRRKTRITTSVASPSTPIRNLQDVFLQVAYNTPPSMPADSSLQHSPTAPSTPFHPAYPGMAGAIDRATPLTADGGAGGPAAARRLFGPPGATQ